MFLPIALLAACAQVRFEVTIAPVARAEPLTGRVLVIVAKSARPEPRFALSPSGPAMFGVDVVDLEPGEPVLVDDGCTGYPWPLRELPPGDYHVQALVDVYEKVVRGDGRELWLPMNDGRREAMALAAGNLHGDVTAVTIPKPATDGAGNGAPAADAAPIELVVNHAIPTRPPPEDTAWVKHVSIASAKLAAFWGQPTAIHATVLLPKGFADAPDARWPVVYTFGHDVPFSFTTDPARKRGAGVFDAATGLESGFDFHEAWNSDGFPRVVAISFQQSTPFFPDSYSVNSANNGPCGDALIEEVMPQIEERFRVLREPWARHVEGASTGGWQALALQLQHPDFFGHAWVLQPDPIDFKSYQLVDLDRDENAFELPLGPFGAVERPFRRTVQGQPVWSVRQLSRFEETLGSRARGGFQLGGWEAVFGPTGDDGYPRPLWDKLTGAIDRATVKAMRDGGFDPRDYAQRHWPELGPKLAGKLHFSCGDMDDFYLNLAVDRFEEFLKAATDPPSDAEFLHGRPQKGHSWHAWPWSEFVRRVAAATRKHAPPGTDHSAWSD